MAPHVSDTPRTENTTNTASMANTMYVSRPPSGAESVCTSDTGSARRVGWGRPASIDGFDAPMPHGRSSLAASSPALTPRPDAWDKAVVASPFVLGFLGLCVIAFGAGIAIQETHHTLASHRTAPMVTQQPPATLKPAADADSKDYVLGAIAATRAEAVAAPLLFAPSRMTGHTGASSLATVTSTPSVQPVARARASHGSSRRGFSRRRR